MSIVTPIERIKAPELRGNNLALGWCRERETYLDGPAGTGKTVAALYKIHRLLSAYPGSRALVARKTNTALSGSAMVTYRDNILRSRRDIRWFGGNKVEPAAYKYSNGSEMIVNGLDKPEKVLSAEFDWGYINEAPECDEEDIEFVRMRLRPRTGGPDVPYRQLIMDGNPGPPTHWLNQRMIAGRTHRLISRHEDNPRYFDLKTNDWTPEGYEYIEGILGGLTGVRLARYRYGIWAAAEGTVYEDSWDRARNIIDPFPIPPDWPRYLSIDFGYTNPFVCLWAALDDDGRLIIYRQLYRSKKIVEDHCKDIAIASGWFHLLPKDHDQYKQRPSEHADPLPHEIIADHDAEDRATFERHLGLMTTPAHKSVSDGIQAVASRFRPAGDGKPRIKIFRNCLIERDEERARAKLPICLEDEPEMYVWKRGTDGSTKEEPVKEHDHGCLVAGTMITTMRGDVPIEQVQIGDYALTRNGYKRVVASGLTVKQAEVYRVEFSNGVTLIGTGNHPIYQKNRGYIPLHALRYNDIIEDINSCKERYPQLCQSLQQKKWSLLPTKESCSGAILKLLPGQSKIITPPIAAIVKRASADCIRKSGKMLMGLFQKGARSIIEMGTRLTMPWITSNASLRRNTPVITQNTQTRDLQRNEERILKMYAHSHQRGIDQKKVGRGTRILVLLLGRMRNITTMLVSNAGKRISPGSYRRTTAVFAPIIASQHGGVMPDWITRRELVSSVEKSSFATSMLSNPTVQPHAQREHATRILSRKQEPAQCVEDYSRLDKAVNKNTAQEHVQAVAVCSISKNEILQPVYNLTVENPVGEGEYFANGVLVHNCDALRYLVASRDLVSNGVSSIKNPWM